MSKCHNQPNIYTQEHNFNYIYKKGFFSPPKLIHEYTQKLGKPPEDNEDLQGGIRHSLLCIPAIWQTSPPPTSSFVSNLCQQEIRTEHLAQII